jgi:hypothetical protein
MLHCIIGPPDLSGSGSAFVRRVGNQSLRRNVTSQETEVQSVESGVPEILQSNTSWGATQQTRTGFELCNRTIRWERTSAWDLPYTTACSVRSLSQRKQIFVAARDILGWVHTCNVTACRNTVSWQCGRDSCPRNVSKVGYAVTLRACSVCCRYLADETKGWYGQIPTAHRTSP